jgi:ATP-dependent DNA ligase
MAEGDFIVIGTERPEGKPPAAHLARQDEHGLTYAGSAFVTVPGKERERFWSHTQELRTESPMSRSRSSKVTLCRPELRVRARYLRARA